MMITEAIRTKKGSKGGWGPRFDMKMFKRINNPTGLNLYAQHFLDFLGEGSSRAAYIYTQKYVLKIATNQKGVAQNNAEIEVYTNPASRPVVAKIHQMDEDALWLISDLVKPLSDESEFMALTGIDFEEFYANVKQGIKENVKSKDSFTQAVIDTARNNQLKPGDLSKIDSWGKTADGRVVLLDYGFTGEVFEKHYKSEPEDSEDYSTSLLGAV